MTFIDIGHPLAYLLIIACNKFPTDIDFIIG